MSAQNERGGRSRDVSRETFVRSILVPCAEMGAFGMHADASFPASRIRRPVSRICIRRLEPRVPAPSHPVFGVPGLASPRPATSAPHPSSGVRARILRPEPRAPAPSHPHSVSSVPGSAFRTRIPHPALHPAPRAPHSASRPASAYPGPQTVLGVPCRRTVSGHRYFF